jgi:hypothetical protein
MRFNHTPQGGTIEGNVTDDALMVPRVNEFILTMHYYLYRLSVFVFCFHYSFRPWHQYPATHEEWSDEASTEKGVIPIFDENLHCDDSTESIVNTGPICPLKICRCFQTFRITREVKSHVAWK